MMDRDTRDNLLVTVGMSIAAYFVSVWMIPPFAESLKKSGLFGRDLNKPKKLAKDIPESLGVVVGCVYVVCIILFQVFQAFRLPFNHSIAEYNAALTSICFMVFLGFTDDVLDLRWRYKLFLPTIASLPLIVAYSGPTSVLIPAMFRQYLGSSIELGIVFQLYMSMLAVFCTNSINILAGINGLEAGQALIIAFSVVSYNIYHIFFAVASQDVLSLHLFSMSLMCPFIAVTAALLRFNWYPSSVFVGDCYTYFAGVTFAVVGILGHFPKTLLLLFIPQVLNFVVSLPQLLKIIPCPRHRLPTYDEGSGKLVPTPNYNLVNLFLRVFGPMTERGLCVALLVFQALCCAAGLSIRYILEGYAL
eukprot:c2561_g1_i1.p1 GENE.c2561_g1_i1~~c2561_g1_i1.p1  ORF type:complete len:361 (-),score=81.72 c2561_g1_i1:185-1267(-)